jgi:hypothetical protein
MAPGRVVMTFSDDITAPDQAIRSDDENFESADFYSDDEYDFEYDDEAGGPDEEQDEDDDEDDDEEEDEDDDEDDEQDALRASW